MLDKLDIILADNVVFFGSLILVWLLAMWLLAEREAMHNFYQRALSARATHRAAEIIPFRGR